MEIHIPVPNDADSPKFKTTVGSVKWVPENSEIVWSIKSFPVSTILGGVLPPDFQPHSTCSLCPAQCCGLAAVESPQALRWGAGLGSPPGASGRVRREGAWRAEELARQGGEAGAFWESRGWLSLVGPSRSSSSAPVQDPLPPSFPPSFFPRSLTLWLDFSFPGGD